MSLTDRDQTVDAPSAAPPVHGYETCEHCEAPVEASQRYCVVCGTRRKHVRDPAVRFLAEATSRSRSVTKSARGAAAPRRRSSGLGLALLLALIPLAVAVGVLIGRPADDTSSKLLAALRAQKPTVVNVGASQTGATTTSGTSASDATAAATTAVGGAAAATPVARLTSSFGLQQGFTVELQTLPGSGTTPASVAAAEGRARARGASAVGLISQADFRITPAPPAGDYVIFSGQYRTAAAATSALGRLKHAFPTAKLVSVRSIDSAPSGPVIAKTVYGSAHQVSGFKASAGQLASGAKVVNQVSKEINGGYVKSQQGLPDAVSVP